MTSSYNSMSSNNSPERSLRKLVIQSPTAQREEGSDAGDLMIDESVEEALLGGGEDLGVMGGQSEQWAAINAAILDSDMTVEEMMRKDFTFPGPTSSSSNSNNGRGPEQPVDLDALLFDDDDQNADEPTPEDPSAATSSPSPVGISRQAQSVESVSQPSCSSTDQTPASFSNDSNEDIEILWDHIVQKQPEDIKPQIIHQPSFLPSVTDLFPIENAAGADKSMPNETESSYGKEQETLSKNPLLERHLTPDSGVTSTPVSPMQAMDEEEEEEHQEMDESEPVESASGASQKEQQEPEVMEEASEELLQSGSSTEANGGGEPEEMPMETEAAGGNFQFNPPPTATAAASSTSTSAKRSLFGGGIPDLSPPISSSSSVPSQMDKLKSFVRQTFPAFPGSSRVVAPEPVVMPPEVEKERDGAGEQQQQGNSTTDGNSKSSNGGLGEGLKYPSPMLRGAKSKEGGDKEVEVIDLDMEDEDATTAKETGSSSTHSRLKTIMSLAKELRPDANSTAGASSQQQGAPPPNSAAPPLHQQWPVNSQRHAGRFFHTQMQQQQLQQTRSGSASFLQIPPSNGGQQQRYGGGWHPRGDQLGLNLMPGFIPTIPPPPTNPIGAGGGVGVVANPILSQGSWMPQPVPPPGLRDGAGTSSSRWGVGAPPARELFNRNGMQGGGAGGAPVPARSKSIVAAGNQVEFQPWQMRDLLRTQANPPAPRPVPPPTQERRSRSRSVIHERRVSVTRYRVEEQQEHGPYSPPRGSNRDLSPATRYYRNKSVAVTGRRPLGARSNGTTRDAEDYEAVRSALDQRRDSIVERYSGRAANTKDDRSKSCAPNQDRDRRQPANTLGDLLRHQQQPASRRRQLSPSPVRSRRSGRGRNRSRSRRATANGEVKSNASGAMKRAGTPFNQHVGKSEKRRRESPPSSSSGSGSSSSSNSSRSSSSSEDDTASRRGKRGKRSKGISKKKMGALLELLVEKMVDKSSRRSKRKGRGRKRNGGESDSSDQENHRRVPSTYDSRSAHHRPLQATSSSTWNRRSGNEGEGTSSSRHQEGTRKRRRSPSSDSSLKTAVEKKREKKTILKALGKLFGK